MKKDGEKEMKFPWVEIGIVIATGSLVGLLTYPQYQEFKKQEKISVTKYNLHVFKVAMEKYALYNQGQYPKTIPEVESTFDFTPTNPYTQARLSQDAIDFFYYSHSGDNRDIAEDGVNGRQMGQPGGIGVGLFAMPVDTIVPEDTLETVDSLVTEYGLVGFDQYGMPITIHNPGGRDFVYLLRN
jgi:Tfp pilus assembly protein PilE